MYGALLAYLLLFKSEVPDTMFRLIAKNCAIFIGLNLFLGFTITGLTPIRIANAGNVAGVVSGFLLGLVVARPLNLKQRRQQVNLKFGLGAVCSILATLIFYVVVSKISGAH
jgi:membrane associated rhomboid family serine protease